MKKFKRYTRPETNRCFEPDLRLIVCVCQVLDGLALDVITTTPNVPEGMKRPVAAAVEAEEEEDDPAMKDMKERYAALKQGM